MWQGDFNFEAQMGNWLVAVDRKGGTPEDEATFMGQYEIMRMMGRQTILGVCYIRCMYDLLYAVLGVCCTRRMLYSVYAVLGVYCTECQLMMMAWRDRKR